MKRIYLFCVVVFTSGYLHPAQAQPFSLSNEFTGPNKCLDIVNDGANNQLNLTNCGKFTGQFWQKTDAKGGYVILQTEFTGPGKCLDVINDGRNDQLTMTQCGNFSGQSWRFDAAGKPGVFRLTNEFTGRNKCLDVVNDGANNHVTLAKCGNFSGQMWRIGRVN